MSAGRGVVHSERTPDELRGQRRRSHGLQLWVALPESDEDAPPTFSHTPQTLIPHWAWGGVSARVLVGQALGARSPVPAASPTLSLDLGFAAGSMLELPAALPTRAVLVGGEPLGHRFVWWNFVSARKERIVAAAGDWVRQPNDRFPQVPGETEFIPLPERRPA
jgi:hypothetical protein